MIQINHLLQTSLNLDPDLVQTPEINQKKKNFKNNHHSNKKYVPYTEYLKERLEKRRKLKTPLIWEFTSDEEEYEKDKLFIEIMRKKEFEELKNKIENGVLENENNNEKEVQQQEDPDTSAEMSEGKRKKSREKDKKKKDKSKKSIKITTKNLRKKHKHKKKKNSSSDSGSSSDYSEDHDSSVMDVEDLGEINEDENGLNGKEKNKEGNERIENFVGPMPLQIDRNY